MEDPTNKNLGQSTLDLDNDVRRRDVPQHLFDLSYWHYGDPDHYKGHIFIPLEASKGDKPFGKVIAYRPSDMSL
jgi:hypothetical protein